MGRRTVSLRPTTLKRRWTATRRLLCRGTDAGGQNDKKRLVTMLKQVEWNRTRAGRRRRRVRIREHFSEAAVTDQKFGGSNWRFRRTVRNIAQAERPSRSWRRSIRKQRHNRRASWLASACRQRPKARRKRCATNYGRPPDVSFTKCAKWW